MRKSLPIERTTTSPELIRTPIWVQHAFPRAPLAVAPQLHPVPRSAAFCRGALLNYSIVGGASDNIRKYARGLIMGSPLTRPTPLRVENNSVWKFGRVNPGATLTFKHLSLAYETVCQKRLTLPVASWLFRAAEL
jgi:hypothetical protein